MAAAFGDRALGALIFVFAVPNLLPLPPGSSALLGAPLLLVAFQLALGRRVLWLPPFLATRTVSRELLLAVTARIMPHLRWVERLLAPRIDVMFSGPAECLMGLAAFVMALVLFLPIPFANALPAAALSLFALGLMQRDGLAVLLGWLVAGLTGFVVFLISGALLIAVEAFFGALADLF